MFSETRYAMNGDLRVAYRASPPGARDIVFVPNWFFCCELFPELPPVQGWVEAMTSLGRLIFFDQPGTGASDPVTSGALPTLEQWADSIIAVLDDLGSREAVLIVPYRCAPDSGGCSPPHIRLAQLRWSCFQGRADPKGISALSASGFDSEEWSAALVDMWGTGEIQHVINPDMPWNEEIGQRGPDKNAGRPAPATVALMLPLVLELDVRAILPDIRVPTLVVHHTEDPIILPAGGRYIADHIPGAKYVELPGRNEFHFVEPWRSRFRRSPSSSPGTRRKSPTTGCSPRCCSPTSWTRHAGLRRWVTVTGMPCSTPTTPSSGRQLNRASGAAR